MLGKIFKDYQKTIINNEKLIVTFENDIASTHDLGETLSGTHATQLKRLLILHGQTVIQ